MELNINHGEKELNEKIFDKLHAEKAEIEKEFGNALSWERMDAKKSCRVSCRLDGVNIMDLAEWQKIIEFQCDAMPRLDNLLRYIGLKGFDSVSSLVRLQLLEIQPSMPLILSFQACDTHVPLPHI